ncbi:hypothetical protein GCM10027277_42710 [Pseudoduganella ginsengisoli]|uniref:PEP-CTERM sorting domain-containing protein n=1 Tax=Pseudoduganella ginsengisoli TaxID=1462440 RepID=A0A6L6Q6B1_9BURK|nr:hypothetical protein [Pseudoduganella ginsengisoli]MTW05125.1 hypothetical protein [Pseudoduganella ginsengisoli]
MRNTVSAITLAVLTLAASTATAGPIPVSYTFDQGTSQGSYVYSDPGFVKLTDGVLGYTGWAVNGAPQWVGWTANQVNVDFTFAGMTAISGVNLGTTQDNLADVVLPSLTVSQWVNGQWSQVGSLTVPASAANDHSSLDTSPHGFLSLSGLNIYSDKVRLTLNSNGPWIFADEVTFNEGVQQDNAMPEPGSMGLLAAGMALLALRPRKAVRRS